MKQRTLASLTIAALLGCAACLALGIRSYRVADRLAREGAADGSGQYAGGYLSSSCGELELTVWLRRDPRAAGRPASGLSWSSGRLTEAAGAYRSRRAQYMRSIGGRGALGFWLAAMSLSPSPGPVNPTGRSAPLPRQSTWILVVPWWFPTILAAALGITGLRMCLRRPRTGHCPHCGYDLRASREQCPECGTPIVPPDGKSGENS
jgi:hypothetical protein